MKFAACCGRMKFEFGSATWLTSVRSVHIRVIATVTTLSFHPWVRNETILFFSSVLFLAVWKQHTGPLTLEPTTGGWRQWRIQHYGLH
jgi:hypothetical protein